MKIENIIIRTSDGDYDLKAEGVPFLILRVLKGGAIHFLYDCDVHMELCKFEGKNAVIQSDNFNINKNININVKYSQNAKQA